MYHFCWNLYQDYNWPICFFPLKFKHILSDINDTINKLGIFINDPIHIKDIVFFFAISILRSRKKNKLTIPESLRIYIPVYKSQIGDSILYDNIEQLFTKNHIYDDNEVYFFILHLITNNIFYKSQVLGKQVVQHHRINKSAPYKLTKLFFKILKNQGTIIKFEEEEYLFANILRAHLKAYIYLSMDITIRKEHLIMLNIPNHKFYSIKTESIIKEMEQTDYKIFYKSKDYLFQQYLIFMLSLNLQITLSTPIKLELNTTFPSVYEDFLKKYIKHHFRYEYNIVFLDSGHIQEPDLILSSLSHTKTDSDKIISISYNFEHRELEKINKYLEKMNNINEGYTDLVE